MAVNNRIAGRTSAAPAAPKTEVVEIKCGDETIKLSPSIVRRYLVNGDGHVTDQEVAMFIGLCKYQHLNPFLREAYLIKYGDRNPATIVTGKEAITKRAMRNERYAGQQAGVVLYNSNTRDLEYRTGSMVMQGEKLVGGWAKVYVKGYDVPIEAAVSFDEYVGTKSDGTINGQWRKKPATMIRKVALMQALREAFPEDLGGMYSSEEVGTDIDEESLAPVEQPEETQQPPQPEDIQIPDDQRDTPPWPAEEAVQATIDDLQGVF